MKKLFRIDDWTDGCFRVVLIGVIVSGVVIYYQFL